ncbi:Cupin 2, conserved barrel [Mycobacteriaceae bacterium]|jgi:gentisate 1,2-dioxygenase
MTIADNLRARYRTAQQIRAEGAIGNLFDGPTITAHGLDTRLLGWPGNGYQTESVHVTNVQPGQQSDQYTYDLAEEAILCRHGVVEVRLRDQWVTLNPGDIAYFPAGVAHRIRNPAGSTEAAILVNQICPPQFDLYSDKGFYNNQLGVMNFDSVQKAIANAVPVTPPKLHEMTFNEDQPAVRAKNLSPDEVRLKGALFNVLGGAPFTGLGLPMRLVLWPGAGTRLTGFNYAYTGIGVSDVIHKHPVSDEFLVMWSGSGQLYGGGFGWVDAEENDVMMAPCGVAHGHRSIEGRGPSMMGGFASPPQLDLMIPSPFYANGMFTHPAASELTHDEMKKADLT